MKKSVISVKNIPTELLKKAKKQAAEEDRNLSQVIRDLLRNWVKKQGPPTK